jgi:hypothetical protein
MRYFLSILVAVAWALWLGGLIAIFLVVTQLSHTFVDRREIFGQAGSAVFMMFERYQLIIGAVALVSSFGLRLMSPSTIRTALFGLLAVAAAGALVSPMYITPKIEGLRQIGQTQSEEFKKLHGRSMMVYSGDALILLAAGVLLPGALKMSRSNEE